MTKITDFESWHRLTLVFFRSLYIFLILSLNNWFFKLVFVLWYLFFFFYVGLSHSYTHIHEVSGLTQMDSFFFQNHNNIFLLSILLCFFFLTFYVVHVSLIIMVMSFNGFHKLTLILFRSFLKLISFQFHHLIFNFFFELIFMLCSLLFFNIFFLWCQVS